MVRASAVVMMLSLALGAGVPCVGAQEPIPEAKEPQEPPTATPDPVPSPAPPLVPGPMPDRLRPDDKRRTVRSYFNNLGYNFLGVVTRGNHKPLLITAALTASSALLDDEGRKYFGDHPHPNWAKIGSNLGGTVAVAGMTVGLFSAGRISRGDKFRATSYDLSQAIIVTAVYTSAIKLTVRRERPDESNKLSFPSGHSSNAFAAATVVARHYPKLAIPLYGVATYIAVSRMAANKHYLSDIVAGGGLGWGIGRAVVRRNGRPPDVQPGKTGEPPPDKTTWQIAPWAGPAGDGRGLTVVVTF
jgi:PAP2 superfamily